MFTTYHLNSADEITSDMIDSIKINFKNKPITITVEEDNTYLTKEQMAILDQRLNEPEEDYISAEESLKFLKDKYGL